MNQRYLKFVFIFIFSICAAQEGFQFNKNQKKVKIPIQLINNLIIIPIELNGVKMNFLLDSGIEETVLFSIENQAQLELFNVEKIKLKGLGSDNTAEGLKSTANTFKFSKLILKNKSILVILDETFNFSSSLGIAVNGIIGYHFFNQNLVEINYESKKIIIHNKTNFNAKKLKNHTAVDITLDNNKPYCVSDIEINDKILSSKMLVDTGNSDYIWYFQNTTNSNVVPKNNFDDFLGRGFSGDINGKRAILKTVNLNNFKFLNPLVAFPDVVSLNNVTLAKDRVGSIGGGILKRFDLFVDYENNKMYLKKNKYFNDSFNFNKSGITLQHNGFQYVKKVYKKNNDVKNNVTIEFGEKKYDVEYKFELKPIFEITNIRKGTPAEDIGLEKGDILISINGTSSYRYSLDQINEVLRSEEGREVILEIERNNIILKKKFNLRSIL